MNDFPKKGRKKAPAMQPKVLRLIADKAIRYSQALRTDLARELQTEIREMAGESAVPTEQTLLRLISEARNRQAPVTYWQMGHMRDTRISPEAVPHIFEVWKAVMSNQSEENQNRLPRIPLGIVCWIADLYAMIPDPLDLYRVANAYAYYEHINNAAGIEQLDTLELDNLLANGKYDVFTKLASGMDELLSEWSHKEVKVIVDGALKELGKGGN
jgi:hypothetical protein